jgi:hypothetical protein
MEASTKAVDIVTRYRRRDICEADLELIRGKIAEQEGQPGGRRAIASAICEAWDWRQPRGTLATRACVDLLLRLEEWGQIQLPPSRQARGSGPRRREHPVLPPELIALTGLDIRDPDVDLDSLVVRPIAPEEREGWRLYMGRYHYLGCKTIVGEHLLYAAFLGDELVALLGWGSAAFRAPLREEYVGWDEPTKRERLHLVANNVRFLVLPRVRVRNLASKVLAVNLRRLSSDWEQTWGHPIHLAETFVDTRRFDGTCYRASNWICLGQTAGRTKRGNAYLHQGSSKSLFVFPLHRQARRLLGGEHPAKPVGTVAAEPSARCEEARFSSRTASPMSGAKELEVTPAMVIARPPDSTSGDHSRQAGLATVACALTALGAGCQGVALNPLPTVSDALAQTGLNSTQEVEPEEPSDGKSLSERSLGGRPGSNRTRIRIELTETERRILERQARGLAVPHRTVVRSKIILLLASGQKISVIARRLGCERGSVRMWGERFERKRLPGLEDADRSGRPSRFSPRNRGALGQAGLRAP